MSLSAATPPVWNVRIGVWRLAVADWPHAAPDYAAMRGYIAVTDLEWYRFLSSNAEIDEVNFWQPSAQTQFGAVEIGEPVIFKLHYPQNAVVGAGFFTWFSIQPSRLAWDSFAIRNGAGSYEEMRARIERYRRVSADPRAEYQIGCVLLRDVFFLAPGDWVAPPGDWRPNIVRGKTYDLAAGEGARVWDELLLHAPRTQAISEPEPAMFGPPALVRRRLGQGAFRVIVTDAYERRCAITNEKTLPVLDAAHIRPVTAGGLHQVENGILLRSDLHTLFDRGYLTVGKDHRIRVSGRLRTDFDNGEDYRRFDALPIRLPARAEFRPDPLALEWHGDAVFLL